MSAPKVSSSGLTTRQRVDEIRSLVAATYNFDRGSRIYLLLNAVESTSMSLERERNDLRAERARLREAAEAVIGSWDSHPVSPRYIHPVSPRTSYEHDLRAQVEALRETLSSVPSSPKGETP